MSNIIELPRVRLTDAAERPNLDFILPGLLAGSVGMIVGQGGIGKSMLSLQIGLSVASGRPVAGNLWGPPAPGPVTIIAGEDSAEILQERQFWLRKSMGIDQQQAENLDESFRVLSGDGFDLRVITQSRDGLCDGPFLATLLGLCEGQRLVIIDPVVLLHDCDENDNGAASHLVRALRRIAFETGATIVVIHHVGKSGGDGREAWTAARGASAYTTSVRWQVNLTPPSSAECEEYGIDDGMRASWLKVLVAKQNYGPPQEPAFLTRENGGILGWRKMLRALSRTKPKGGLRRGVVPQPTGWREGGPL